MGVHAFVPVQEAFHVDDIADSQSFCSLVNFGVSAGEVGFDGEGVDVFADLSVEVNVVALRAGAVPVVQESSFCAVCIGGCNDGRALEGNEFVLVLDQFIGTEPSVCFGRGCNPVAVENFECSVHDFNFACPFALEALDLDLGAGSQLVVIVLRDGHFINEVCAFLVLGVDGSDANAVLFPPALLCLNISFDGNLGVECCCCVFSVGHNAFALDIGLFAAAASNHCECENTCEK